MRLRRGGRTPADGSVTAVSRGTLPTSHHYLGTFAPTRKVRRAEGLTMAAADRRGVQHGAVGRAADRRRHDLQHARVVGLLGGPDQLHAGGDRLGVEPCRLPLRVCTKRLLWAAGSAHPVLDGRPAPGRPIRARRPAAIRVDRAGGSTTVEAGGPRRGGQAGNRPRLAAVTSRRYQQERLSSSTGYIGVHRAPAPRRIALSLQQERQPRRGWTPRRGLVPQPGRCQPGSGQELPARLVGWSSGNPSFRVGAGGWALPPAGVRAS
jgi:hypothetical protein